MSLRQKREPALIVLNGPLPPKHRYEDLLSSKTVVICADGGADRARAEGITPDFVIGDLDSLSDQTRKRLSDEKLIRLPSQYAPDVEKALRFALDQGIESAIVVGVSGDRLDHQVCNLNILEKFSDRIDLTIIDQYGMGCFVRDRLKFSGLPGQQVSLFAFRHAEGIVTQGLKYPLENARMEWAVNDGLSNEIVESPVEIGVRKGVLFVYQVWAKSS